MMGLMGCGVVQVSGGDVLRDCFQGRVGIYLDHEAIFVPWVVVHDNSANVADCFCYAAGCDDGAEGWEASLDCKAELGAGCEAEDYQEDNIGGQVRCIAISGCFDGT